MANLSQFKVSKLSYETIKDSAANLTSDKWKTYANPTATAAQAPYLLNAISDGDYSLDELAAAAAKQIGDSCTFEQARYYWSGMLEQVKAILTGGEYTGVDFGYWTFELGIEGSIASANAAPTLVDNPVYIGVYPSKEFQNVASTIELIADTSSDPFIINCVFDEDGNHRIKGGDNFLVMGDRFTAPSAIKLIAPDDTEYACTYVGPDTELPSRIRATAPASVERTGHHFSNCPRASVRRPPRMCLPARNIVSRSPRKVLVRTNIRRRRKKTSSSLPRQFRRRRSLRRWVIRVRRKAA